MSFDVALMVIIVGGVGLSAAYVREEYLRWRKHGAAERRKEMSQRELHAARLSEQQNPDLLPSVLQLQGFGEDEAANPEGAADAGAARRTSALPGSLHAFGGRRKRDRQQATH
jgi:hypothetical protein